MGEASAGGLNVVVGGAGRCSRDTKVTKVTSGE